MRIAPALLLWFAVASSAMAADDKVESVVSGTVTIQMVPATQPGAETRQKPPDVGQVIVRFGPQKSAAEPNKLEQCGDKWNKELADHVKRVAKEKTEPTLRGQIEKPLTRFDYRKYMYDCLTAPAEDAQAPGPADVRPAGS